MTEDTFNKAWEIRQRIETLVKHQEDVVDVIAPATISNAEERSVSVRFRNRKGSLGDMHLKREVFDFEKLLTPYLDKLRGDIQQAREELASL